MGVKRRERKEKLGKIGGEWKEKGGWEWKGEYMNHTTFATVPAPTVTASHSRVRAQPPEQVGGLSFHPFEEQLAYCERLPYKTE